MGDMLTVRGDIMFVSPVSSIASEPPPSAARGLPLTWAAALAVNLAIWAAIIGAARAFL
jgi:hypothetical protein